jgi:hypothetical protein
MLAAGDPAACADQATFGGGWGGKGADQGEHRSVQHFSEVGIRTEIQRSLESRLLPSLEAFGQARGQEAQGGATPFEVTMLQIGAEFAQ